MKKHALIPGTSGIQTSDSLDLTGGIAKCLKECTLIKEDNSAEK